MDKAGTRYPAKLVTVRLVRLLVSKIVVHHSNVQTPISLMVNAVLSVLRTTLKAVITKAPFIPMDNLGAQQHVDLVSVTMAPQDVLIFNA